MARDFPPNHIVCLAHKRLAGLIGTIEPVYALCDRLHVVGSASLAQIKQRHWTHRVLVDAVDWIALNDRSVAGVIVPPPLALRPLKPTNRAATRIRSCQCFRVMR